LANPDVARGTGIASSQSITLTDAHYLPLVFRAYAPRLDPSDPWYLARRQWGLEVVRAPNAWPISKGHGVTIAIVDTGVDLAHADLRGQLWSNPGEVAGNGVDDDGDGYVDDVHGWDFVSGDSDPQDEQGHGTHVAGVAGATTDNAVGIAGMGWNVSLMSVRVLDGDGDGTVWRLAQGIRYAVDRGARVINLSLGGYGADPTTRSAVAYAQDKGCLVVASAGNDGDEAGFDDKPPFYPAAYGGVLGVAATDSGDRRASFSNYGAYVDVAAPGVQIYSAVPSGGYGYLSGTSMSAPLVSGLAALLWARDPTAAPSAVAEAMVGGAEDLGDPGWDPYYGWGRIDALQALYAVPSGTSVSSAGSAARGWDGGGVDVGGGRTVDRAYVPGELVLQVRGSLSSQELARMLRARGLSVLQKDEAAGLYLVRVATGSEEATAAALRVQRGVLYADSNYVVSAVR
jgi:subtilisin family serine protease